MSNINGILRTGQKGSMSLFCRGEIKIKDGIIKEISFRGMPRNSGDAWTDFFSWMKKIGDNISKAEIDKILSYDGREEVYSKFYKDGAE